ncbi:alpha-L-fucosidase [Mariniblastus sp.]|nr:alpha-L-fucosidase [Mariniblastus sp.]
MSEIAVAQVATPVQQATDVLAEDESPSVAVVVKDFSGETEAEKAARMKWFTDARFGMFIHWGLYAQPAGVWKGKDIPGVGEWIQRRAQIPTVDYEPLQKTFNPVKYNAEQWVLLAKQAGMKYIVITSKHHDGFCLYDSKFSDWDMGGTPYKKDLLDPLAAACRKHGLKMCFYHSILDWHHPQFAAKAKWTGSFATENPDMEIYRTYMKDQLHELLTNYGDVGIVWFDGEWAKCWTHEMGVDLYNYCRTLQPNTIVNNRVDKGRRGMAGMTASTEFVGDYGTPEQEIPQTGFGDGVFWESCMTMNKTWGFKLKDHEWKSSEKLIRNLIDLASKGGNFLLNVGPTAEGEIPEASVERLQAMGKWMDSYGQSIYETSASPLNRNSWDGRCTQKKTESGTRLYFHVFEWPTDGVLNIKYLKNKPVVAKMMGTEEALSVTGESGDWKIQLPSTAPDEIASVVQVDIAGSPEVEPYLIVADDTGSFSLTPGEAVLKGRSIRIAKKKKDQPENIGMWSDMNDRVLWNIDVAKAGKYRPKLRYACEDDAAGSSVEFQIGNTSFPLTVAATGKWTDWKNVDLPEVNLAAGPNQVLIQPKSIAKKEAMRLESMVLEPVDSESGSGSR